MWAPRNYWSVYLNTFPIISCESWFRGIADKAGGQAFCSAQLFRTLLLSALTPAHSFNLLSRTLRDNRSWRRFAFLSHRDRVPGPRVLHEFRQKLPPLIFRQINRHLLLPLLEQMGAGKSVALIDATDLRAATNAYKKTEPELTPLIAPPWAGAA